MKSIKLLLSAVAILVGGLFANTQAQCAASFVVDSMAAPAGSVMFNSTSTGTSSQTFYQWTFSGATPSSANGFYLDSVVVTYPSIGWYTICLTITDSSSSCTSVMCDSVYIAVASGSSNPTLSAGSTNASCGACNGTAFLSASGGTAPYTYVWSNGATTATITSLCAGTYNATVTDANGNSATASATVGSTGGVAVQISGNSDCFGAQLFATVTSGASPYTYNWSNGQTTANAFYPSSGSAYAEVIVTDANGCTGIDSTYLNFAPTFTVSASATNETCLSCCDGTASISTSGGPSNSPFAYSWSNGDNGASISGLCPGTYSVTVTDTLNGCDVTSSVTIGAFTCPTISGSITQGEGAMVYLIQENSGVLSAVDSVVSDSMGYYYFFNACPGTYYVKAALLPSHSLYAYHVPTYYVSSSLWASATAVIVSGNTTGIDINLLTGTNLSGPGFIGGAVSQGANRGEGDPVIGAQVILLDANGDVSAFTTTDANGEYAFENLAYGNYSVYVEKINFDAYPFEVVVSADNEEVQDRNFVVEGGKIKPVTPLGVNSISAVSFEMYPNPANGLVTFTGTVDQVEIINILGETVLVKSNNGAVNMNLDITSLTSGQYIVSVKQGDKNSFAKLIVE